MFYSQYILAKKGPLGTIWIAAHLERKLRKNQVTETDILRSVDSIMFPEVPIALRLSSHLLLGVVRIYSRKVNYLFHDCNEALLKLKNAFTSSSAPVDHPTTVPFHSITLPETFEFDAIEPDEAFYDTYSLEHHVTTRDQITLDEPLEDDVYPGSQFEQEERFGTPHVMDPDANEDTQNYRNSDRSELQEDVLPPMYMDTGPLTNEAEAPDVEKLRSAGNNNVDEDFLESFEKHDASQLELQPDPARLDTPAESTRLAEDEQPSLSPPSLRPEASSPSHISSLQRSGGSPDGTPGLAVVETPVPSGKKPTSKKRKQRFDTTLTLSESEMKGNLNDSSDLRRVRRKVANARHEILHTVKERLGKRIFSKPSVPGLCSGLEELYDRALDVKRLKPSGVTFARDNRPANYEIPAVPEEPQVPIATDQYPASPAVVASQFELRSPARHAEASVWQTPGLHLVSTPENEGRRPEELQTPINTYFQGMETDATPSANFDGETDQTPSNELRSKANEDIRTKAFEKTVSAAIEDVELSNTNGPAIDSSFLLSNNDVCPLSSQSEGWSERSRAIAQFLRATFEAAPNVKVSIDSLLKGKARKEAARMFFETLVLQSNDYITVQQDSPYKDISIYGQPKLMKAIF